jgi:hypothetical protein
VCKRERETKRVKKNREKIKFFFLKKMNSRQK